MATVKHSTRRRKEAGYTLLYAVFLVATLMIAATAVYTRVDTEGRRQKEEEMIWRGNQYARAVGLYFRKFGKFPTSTEDLTKQTNGVRFLRQAYTDPMNKEDGSWRFIHVVNGQLIDSLRPASLLQNAVGSGVPATSPFGPMAQPQSPSTGTGATGQQPVTGANTSSTTTSDSQPQPLGGTVIGGNIIGVGSKVKKPSLRVYQGADTYEEWEFIWNPVGQRIPGQNNPGIGPNPSGQPTLAPGTTPPQPPPTQ
jgi:hypothetical protein